MKALQVTFAGPTFGDPPVVAGQITLDDNGDMVFDDNTQMELLDRFFRSTGGEIDRTDAEVFNELYSTGGYSNGRWSVTPAP